METDADKLNGLHILLVVTGGVAAYKAVELASRLTTAGARISTVMTDNACRFVGPKSFESVTQSPVFTSLWSKPEEYKTHHIQLAESADIVAVAPATADILAKLAHGICDDLASTTLAACWDKPLLIAPAMNSRMWNNPAVQKNVNTLRQMGFEIVGPETGRLASGEQGQGRMTEPEQILQAIENIAAALKKP